ncbi:MULTISPECIES: hypothetical protein [unclassified Nodularia (in: cyanobacteria)]|nr:MULTISPECIES: hypothetical protein [unclassified Nodularia (in: cyanobacteria)]
MQEINSANFARSPPLREQNYYLLAPQKPEDHKKIKNCLNGGFI